jgi:hypothetical protein
MLANPPAEIPTAIMPCVVMSARRFIASTAVRRSAAEAFAAII